MTKMIRVNLCIEEEVNEQKTEMKTKYLAKQQLLQRLYKAFENGNEEIEKIIDCMSWSIQKPPEPTWSTKVDQEVSEYINDHLLDNIVNGLLSYEDITKLFHWHLEHSEEFSYITQREYDQKEALDLICNLHDFEETEKYLIGNGDIDEQLSNKAAWTYSNAIYHEIEMKLKEIKSNIDIDEISLEVADNILIDERSPKGYDDMEDSDVIEYAKEHYEDEFDKKLEDALRERVLEEL